MATPVLRVLAHNFSFPTVLAPSHIQELLKEDSQGLQYLAPLSGRGLSTVIAEARRLRKMGFEMVILINRSFRSAAIAKMARIPQRIGHNTEHRGFLLTLRVPHSRRRFEAASYGDLVEAIGIPGDFSRPFLTVTPEEIRRGRELGQGASIGVQPGASFTAKMIPTDRLAQAVANLQGAGCKLVMLGGHEEKPIGEKLQNLVSKPLVNLIGGCTLRESMGVVAGLKACLGASTGIMHVAAATGCPTVTVFGDTVVSRWGHNYPPHQSIQVRGDMRAVDPESMAIAVLKAVEAYP